MEHINPRSLETKSLPLPLETKEDNEDEVDPVEAVKQLADDYRDFAKKQETRFDDLEKKRLAKLIDRLDKLETKLNRPGATGGDDDEPTIERKAFVSFLRRGLDRCEPDEIKALTTAVPADGGYINSPAEFLRELDRNLVQFSPIRSVARVSNTSVGQIILPKRTAGVTAQWVGETAARPSTQPTYGQSQFDVKEAAAYVDVSNRLIEDAVFNIEAELAHDFGEEFGRLESAAFWNGAGGDEPTGLMSAGITSVPSAGAGAVIADDLIDLFHALPAPYASNATWAMNRTTIGAVRKLKASDGHYLWVDALTAGNPATILGRPVIECPEAPDITAGSGSPVTSLPIVFGDFSHFRIFDRIAVSILRDPYTQQTNGQVRFHARRRLAGGVSKAEAFRMLEVG